MEYSLHPFSDHGILIDIGKLVNEATMRKIQAISAFLDEQPFPWMIEYVPAFTTITIFYNPVQVQDSCSGALPPYDYVNQQVSNLLEKLINNQISKSRVVRIPVCYGGEFGPDLQFVAHYNNLTKEDVIKLHSSSEYLVYMIGFAPGFPYIGGMSKKISTPRKNTPSLKIPAGSVGIAGNQTGIYPLETPGGWQLIGRTPVKLFNPEKDSPSLLKAGDKISFFPITAKEYFEWKEHKQ